MAVLADEDDSSMDRLPMNPIHLSLLTAISMAACATKTRTLADIAKERSALERDYRACSGRYSTSAKGSSVNVNLISNGHYRADGWGCTEYPWGREMGEWTPWEEHIELRPADSTDLGKILASKYRIEHSGKNTRLVPVCSGSQAFWSRHVLYRRTE
jgi:hypothetical protein